MQDLLQLPVPSSTFLVRKEKIIAQLSVPDAEYADASPKGSVDEGIRDLIDEINSQPGFVTTSSCAGRVSVFLEGKKTADEDHDHAQVAGVGGKGAGGTWLYVSHEPSTYNGDNHSDWMNKLGLTRGDESEMQDIESKERRLVHFKFEPMVSSTRPMGYMRRFLLTVVPGRFSTSSQQHQSMHKLSCDALCRQAFASQGH